MDTPSREAKKSGAPLGLLSPANADLYRRFEAEEAKTSHLRAKEKTQSASLAQLTARLDGLNKSLLAEENHCDKRTAQIKEELDALDREELALDVQLKLKKKQLQHMSTAVADIKVQLAYNFVSMPRHSGSGGVSLRPATAGSRRSSTVGGPVSKGQSAAQPAFNVAQFAETLSDSEMAEIVGESYFVDDQGTQHRVVFSDPADDEDPMAPHRSPTTSASPNRSSNVRKHHAKDEHRGSRLSRSGSTSGKSSSALAKSMWLQSTGAKRATYLLLEDARRITATQLSSVQHTYQSGGYAVDAVYAAEVAALQQHLDTIYQATHALLLTTPTSQSLLANQPTGALAKELSAPLSRSTSKVRVSTKGRKVPSSPLHPVDGEDEAIAASVGRALPVLPVTSSEFATAFAAQRQELIGLRHALSCEEQLVEKKHTMPDGAWCAAAHKADQIAFEASRAPSAEHSDAAHGDGVLPPRWVPTPPTGQRSNKPTPDAIHVKQPSLPANAVVRSNSVPRPASAPQMARYATAATRILHGKGHPLATCRKHEERYLSSSTTSGGGTARDGGSVAAEYHLRSHSGLAAAIESIASGGRPKRRHVDDEYYAASSVGGGHDV